MRSERQGTNMVRSLGIGMALAIMLTGCGSKVYVDRPIEVMVPVKCEIPEVVCKAGQPTYTEEIKEMRLCIERYKQAIEVCK